jgi:calcium binding protein
MRKPAKDPIREDRIHNEAIVDAHGPEEKAMSWYYYLENKISFPFPAKCICRESGLATQKTRDCRNLRPRA